MIASQHRDDAVHLIKETADIVTVIGEYIQLKRSGANLKGLCPFHAEKTPSFMVNPARQTYHCFGCGEGGDVFNFVMQYHNMTFPEALKELAQRFQVSLPEQVFSGQEMARAKKRQTLQDANEKAAALFHDFLLHSPEASGAREYLKKRGVSEELASKFHLGFAPERWDFLVHALPKAGFSLEDGEAAGLLVKKDRGGYYDRFRNRVLFPIHGLTGRVIGFGGRIMGDGQPKYLNSPESPIFDKGKTLFGLYQGRDAVRQARQCLLVEGNFDLLAVVSNGFDNAAAPLGTALTASHIRALKGYCDEAILVFDGDEAGVKASVRAVPLFLTEQVTARVVILPEQHDPDTFLQEFGADEFRRRLDNALSLPEFLFESLLRRHGLTLEGKSRILADLKPVIAAIGNEHLQRTVFISHFSEKLGVTPEQMQEGMSPVAERRAEPPPAMHVKKIGKMSAKERQLLEFLICYPEYVVDLLAVGLEEVILSGPACAILAQLKAMSHEEGAAAPELLLARVEGPERAFVSQILLEAPVYSDEAHAAMAAEITGWLKRESKKKQKERLIKEIGAAQQVNDEGLYMRLIGKMQEVDQ